MVKRRKDWKPQYCDVCFSTSNELERKLKLCQTCKQWRDHRRHKLKLKANDIVKEDIIANYMNDQTPQPVPEFSFTPDLVITNITSTFSLLQQPDLLEVMVSQPFPMPFLKLTVNINTT